MVQLSWRGWGKHPKTSVMIANVPTEIWIVHLPNTSCVITTPNSWESEVRTCKKAVEAYFKVLPWLSFAWSDWRKERKISARVWWQFSLQSECYSLNKNMKGQRRYEGCHVDVSTNSITMANAIISHQWTGISATVWSAKAMSHTVTNARMTTVSNNKTKQTPWSLVRERTIPTERPPLVDEI
jgi:hypothetical protein